MDDVVSAGDSRQTQAGRRPCGSRTPPCVQCHAVLWVRRAARPPECALYVQPQLPPAAVRALDRLSSTTLIILQVHTRKRDRVSAVCSRAWRYSRDTAEQRAAGGPARSVCVGGQGGWVLCACVGVQPRHFEYVAVGRGRSLAPYPNRDKVFNAEILIWEFFHRAEIELSFVHISFVVSFKSSFYALASQQKILIAEIKSTPNKSKRELVGNHTRRSPPGMLDSRGGGLRVQQQVSGGYGLGMGGRSCGLQQIYLVERNVRTFDISIPVQAFHFASFLLRLRDDQVVFKNLVQKKPADGLDQHRLRHWTKAALMDSEA